MWMRPPPASTASGRTGPGRSRTGSDPVRRCLISGLAAAFLALAAPAIAQPPPVQPLGATVVWAWERPETLDTLPPEIGIAAVVGFIRLRGDAVVVSRGRRFPLVTAPGRPQPMAVVHIELDQTQTLAWSPRLADQVVGAALAFVRDAAQVQVDMEVRSSQRGALLDVLHGVRAGLAPGVRLSMTALASWCDSETWLDAAPVDEIVPMLFRMGRGGSRLRAKLAAGGDFNHPRCRMAVGVATDTPVAVPPGRRLYVFNPRPWDAAALAALPPG